MKSVVLNRFGSAAIPMTDTVTLTFDSDGEAESPNEMEVPRQLGNVHLIEEVGRGGMGVVWRGHDEFLRRDVAVKILRRTMVGGDAQLRKQFIEGARAAAGVRHPKVVSLYHADEIQDVIYLVMEFVDGSTLRDVLNRRGALEPRLAALMIVHILEALEAIHSAEVVHRDLKPTNVMFNRDGEIFVSDFGLSYQRSAMEAEDKLASGTPPYMAPEMFAGDTSFQSDIYAVGIVFFELLTGRRPFQADTFGDYQLQHLDSPLPEEPLSRCRIDEATREIILRAANKKKIFRYKKAAHMLHALSENHPGLMKDVGLNRQLKALILETGDGGADRQPKETQSTPATYNDLLSQRADAKRRRKDSDSK